MLFLLVAFPWLHSLCHFPPSSGTCSIPLWLKSFSENQPAEKDDRFLLSYKPLRVMKQYKYKKGHYSWEQRGRRKSLSPTPSLVSSETLPSVTWSKQICPVCWHCLKRWGVNESVMDCSLSLLQHCMKSWRTRQIFYFFYYQFLVLRQAVSLQRTAENESFLKGGVDHLNNVVISCLSLLFARET